MTSPANHRQLSNGNDKLFKLTDCQFEDAKIKSQNAKLWNLDSIEIIIFMLVLQEFQSHLRRLYEDLTKTQNQKNKGLRIRRHQLCLFCLPSSC